MDQESITRGIISGIVDHYIREIAEDPNRSIRKLLDMAERTSEGPTQKICYQMMQQMAADPNSPYYEMIHHLVTHTDAQTINNFGINLGHNAWTFGCGNLRRIISRNNVPVSWAVIIDRRQTADRIPFSEIRDLVNRGRKHEVYAWLIYASEALDEWDDYAALFREHSDSVFGIAADSEALNEQIAEDAASIHNLMFLLNTDSQDWQQSAILLSENRLLYSVCRFVDSKKRADEILSGVWLEQMIPYHPVMAFAIAADSLNAETAHNIKEYMWNTRLEQIYPVLPADLISDFVIINRLVTHQDILYRVNPDGSVHEAASLQFSPCSLTVSNLFS